MRGRELVLEAEATIGAADGNAVVLDDPLVSGEHARIWLDEERGCYLIEDLGSLNGTEVDGVPLTHPEPLTGLHVITFAGVHDFVFQRLEGGGEEDDGAAAAAGAAPVLSVASPDGRTRRFPLTDGSFVVGRGEDADIRIDSDAISRRHARLTVAAGRVTVADLGSRNHTFVDGEQVASEVEVELGPGAVVRFADVEARLGGKASDGGPPAA